MFLLQKLRAESGIMKKKFASLQKEMEDQKEGVRKQQAEVTKLHAVIVCMEKDIVVLKKEIQERDDTIQEKVCHFVLAIPFTTVLQLSINPFAQTTKPEEEPVTSSPRRKSYETDSCIVTLSDDDTERVIRYLFSLHV